MKHSVSAAFPQDFLWGASTSAFQCEGAAAEDGRGPIGRDLHKPIPGTTDFSVASDFYHHYQEDNPPRGHRRSQPQRSGILQQCH